jgi:uncharacterized protein YkwD
MKNFLSFCFILFSFFLAAQKLPVVPDSVFLYYKTLNDKDTSLAAFKDDDATLKLKLIQLEIINQSRKKNKAEAVKLDILASRVANKMCVETTDNDYMGHFNLAGEKPYHRYAFAGGKDHISENAAAKWIVGGTLETTDEAKLEAMKFLHGKFMAERAPHDGHKKNCIDKIHNYVGLGLSAGPNRLSYYEEFVDRYLVFDEVPAVVKADEEFKITVTAPKDQFLMTAIVYFEKFPRSMSAKKINKIDHYEDFSSKIIEQVQPWTLAALKKNKTYSIPFKFKKPGLYYIHLYLDKTELPKEKGYSTKKWMQVSGIVVKVE